MKDQIDISEGVVSEIRALIEAGEVIDRGDGFVVYGPLRSFPELFVRVYETGVLRFRDDGKLEIPVSDASNGRTVTLTAR